VTRQSGSPPDVGNKYGSSTCQPSLEGDDDQNDYEDTSPDAKLIASANMTVLNRNESSA
jgi:hypothetical protein